MNMHFEIVQPIAVLSTNVDKDGRRWNMELNYVSWLDRKPVYDIRAWNENHGLMHYGVKLNREELTNLYEGLRSLFERGEI